MEGFSARPNGFWVAFANGYGVSVQFGVYNYCDKYPHNDEPEDPKELFTKQRNSIDAEIAVIAPCGELMRFFEGDDTVKGWVKPNDLLDVMMKVAAMEASDGNN